MARGYHARRDLHWRDTSEERTIGRMGWEPEQVRQAMVERSDAELARVVTVDAARFTAEALQYAHEEIARRKARLPGPPQPLPPASNPLDERERHRLAATFYREPRTWTAILSGLVVLQLAATAVTLAGYATQWILIANGRLHGALAGLANDAIVDADRLRRLTYWVAIFTFFTWLHRMYQNLPSLGQGEIRFSAWGAVGYFFIPFVNLVRGFQVMDHLWKRSQPLAEPPPTGMTLRSSSLVGWWWGIHLSTNVFLWMRSAGPSKTIEQWRQNSYVMFANLIVVSIAGVLFLRMVRGIARRQREQWDDIVRRQPQAPQPDRPL
jgi:hypothetical protein